MFIHQKPIHGSVVKALKQPLNHHSVKSNLQETQLITSLWANLCWVKNVRFFFKLPLDII